MRQHVRWGRLGIGSLCGQSELSGARTINPAAPVHLDVWAMPARRLTTMQQGPPHHRVTRGAAGRAAAAAAASSAAAMTTAGHGQQASDSRPRKISPLATAVFGAAAAAEPQAVDGDRVSGRSHVSCTPAGNTAVNADADDAEPPQFDEAGWPLKPPLFLRSQRVVEQLVNEHPIARQFVFGRNTGPWPALDALSGRHYQAASSAEQPGESEAATSKMISGAAEQSSGRVEPLKEGAISLAAVLQADDGDLTRVVCHCLQAARSQQRRPALPRTASMATPKGNLSAQVSHLSFSCMSVCRSLYLSLSVRQNFSQSTTVTGSEPVIAHGL